jgi:hypothetical protein
MLPFRLVPLLLVLCYISSEFICLFVLANVTAQQSAEIRVLRVVETHTIVQQPVFLSAASSPHLQAGAGYGQLAAAQYQQQAQQVKYAEVEPEPESYSPKTPQQQKGGRRTASSSSSESKLQRAFKSLSPESPLQELRDFVKNHKLEVSTGIGGHAGRTKKELFADIQEVVQG